MKKLIIKPDNKLLFIKSESINSTNVHHVRLIPTGASDSTDKTIIPTSINEDCLTVELIVELVDNFTNDGLHKIVLEDINDNPLTAATVDVSGNTGFEKYITRL
jgi:hypothetical protein